MLSSEEGSRKWLGAAANSGGWEGEEGRLRDRFGFLCIGLCSRFAAAFHEKRSLGWRRLR